MHRRVGVRCNLARPAHLDTLIDSTDKPGEEATVQVLTQCVSGIMCLQKKMVQTANLEINSRIFVCMYNFLHYVI